MVQVIGVQQSYCETKRMIQSAAASGKIPAAALFTNQDMQILSANYKENHTEVASGHLYSNIKDYNIFIVDEMIIDKGSYIVLILRIFGIFIFLIII